MNTNTNQQQQNTNSRPRPQQMSAEARRALNAELKTVTESMSHITHAVVRWTKCVNTQYVDRPALYRVGLEIEGCKGLLFAATKVPLTKGCVLRSVVVRATGKYVGADNVVHFNLHVYFRSAWKPETSMMPALRTLVVNNHGTVVGEGRTLVFATNQQRAGARRRMQARGFDTQDLTLERPTSYTCVYRYALQQQQEQEG